MEPKKRKYGWYGAGTRFDAALIEEVRPTLLIDEVDTFLGGNEEMRGILNSGYTRKTAYVLRVVNEGTGMSVFE